MTRRSDWRSYRDTGCLPTFRPAGFSFISRGGFPSSQLNSEVVVYVQTRRAFSNTGRSPQLYPCIPLWLRLVRLWQKPPTRSPFFPSRYPLPTVLVSHRTNRRNRTEPKFKRWIPSVDFLSLSRDLWIAVFSVSRHAKQPLLFSRPRPGRRRSARFAPVCLLFVQMASPAYKRPCPPSIRILLVARSQTWLIDHVRPLLSESPPGLTIDHNASIYEAFQCAQGPFSLRVCAR